MKIKNYVIPAFLATTALLGVGIATRATIQKADLEAKAMFQAKTADISVSAQDYAANSIIRHNASLASNYLKNAEKEMALIEEQKEKKFYTLETTAQALAEDRKGAREELQFALNQLRDHKLPSTAHKLIAPVTEVAEAPYKTLADVQHAQQKLTAIVTQADANMDSLAQIHGPILRDYMDKNRLQTGSILGTLGIIVVAGLAYGAHNSSKQYYVKAHK